MAFAKQTAAAMDEMRPYLHGVAKHLVDSLWGPHGPAWGTKLSEIEDLVVAIRKTISERMLQQALQRQAAEPVAERPAEYRHCPSCQGILDTDDPEPRLVNTRGGEAEWQEPRDFCHRCRRAFFPSVQESGN